MLSSAERRKNCDLDLCVYAIIKMTIMGANGYRKKKQQLFDKHIVVSTGRQQTNSEFISAKIN